MVKMLAKAAIALLAAMANFTAADICSPVTERKNTEGFVCDALGSLRKPSPLLKAATITEGNIATARAACRNRCLENSNCKSFSFNAKTRSCQLYNRNPEYQGFQAGRGGSLYTDRFCYIQNYTTAPGLQNPTFDQDAGAKFLQPWERVAGAPQGLPTRYAPGYQSAYAAKLQVGTSVGAANSTLTQVFDICPNSTYFISPYFRFLGQGNSSSTLSINLQTGTGAVQTSCSNGFTLLLSPQMLPDDWTAYPYEFGHDDCGSDNITSCKGTELVFIGQKYATAISLSFSAFYNDQDPDMPPPVLDQWLVDFVVKKIVSTPGPQTSGRVNCTVVDVRAAT